MTYAERGRGDGHHRGGRPRERVPGAEEAPRANGERTCLPGLTREATGDEARRLAGALRARPRTPTPRRAARRSGSPSAPRRPAWSTSLTRGRTRRSARCWSRSRRAASSGSPSRRRRTSLQDLADSVSPRILHSLTATRGRPARARRVLRRTPARVRRTRRSVGRARVHAQGPAGDDPHPVRLGADLRAGRRARPATRARRARPETPCTPTRCRSWCRVTASCAPAAGSAATAARSRGRSRC